MPAPNLEDSATGKSDPASKIAAIPPWDGFLRMDLEFGGRTMK